MAGISAIPGTRSERIADKGMSRRRTSREVEIFNFSFLDILACTIGLLIFIMVMVFILQTQSPVADTHAIARHRMDDAARLRRAAETDAQIVNALEVQLSRIHAPEAQHLEQQRETVQKARDAAKEEDERKRSELEAVRNQLIAMQSARDQTRRQAQQSLAAARKHFDEIKGELDAATAALPPPGVALVPSKHPGAQQDGFNVLHVDCRSGEVVVFRVDEKGTIEVVGRTALRCNRGFEFSVRAMRYDGKQAKKIRSCFFGCA